jgi:hypothetical protein
MWWVWALPGVPRPTTHIGHTGRNGHTMPLIQRPGTSVDALDAAITSLERDGHRIVQVVGQFAGQWALLTEQRPARGPQEKRR